MKKTILALAIALLFASCGNKSQQSQNAEEQVPLYPLSEEKSTLPPPPPYPSVEYVYGVQTMV